MPFSSAFWRSASLMQKKREMEEEQRRYEEGLPLERAKTEAYQDYTKAQQEKWNRDADRQAQEDVWGRAEQIFETTGDPDQALGYLNQNLGTDFKYLGDKEDWLLFGSPQYGKYAWNWRTKENRTLLEPKAMPPKMQSYERGGKKITEWVDQETGEVVRKAEAPRWKPEGASPKNNLTQLVKAYNANLKGVATEIGVHLRPEERATIANLPEDSPMLAAMLLSSVEKAALPPEVKTTFIQKIQTINSKFLPAINQAVNVKVPSGVEGGKKLDKETAKRFLQTTGGDKEKARELAKRAGYVF